MARTGKILSAIFGMSVILTGFSILGVAVYLLAGSEMWPELIAIIILGVLLEAMVVALPHGTLSVGFALIFTTFLLFGTEATIVTASLSALFSQGIINRGSPLRTTLFNGAQYAVTVFLADLIYTYLGGTSVANLQNPLPLVAWVISFYVLNHLIVNFYLSPRVSKDNFRYWKSSLLWDGFTYIFAIPLGVLTYYLYEAVGIKGLVLLFVLVLLLKYLLKLYVGLQIVTKEQMAAFSVAKSLGSSLDIEKTLKVILAETKNMVSYHSAIIFLWREEEQLLLPAAVESPFEAEFNKLTVRMGEGVIGVAAKTREAAIVYDSRKDPVLKKAPGIGQLFRSLVVIPMIADDTIVGVAVFGQKIPDGFKPQQLQALTIVVSQGSVATAKALLYRKIESLAITDGLTKLHNRRYFQERINEEWARASRYKQVFTVIIMDIDHFKKFNDTYGHAAGDKVLKRVAKVLRGALRNVDVLARYGGEEFIVLLPQTPTDKGFEVAERICRAIRGTPVELGHNLPIVNVTLSLGVASYPKDAETPEELIELADKALYKAKESGRNRACQCSTI